MYVFPVTIYREYVQNAADAIDEARRQGLIGPTDPGEVNMRVDHATRTVVIRDNGCGLPVSDAVPALLAIGASPKRGTRARGFRGVGRLSGLAYCQELEFRTKAKGDTSALNVLWDCTLLRSRLTDRTFKGDIRHVIAGCTEVWYSNASNPDEHFFEITMRNISRHRHDMLLNEKMIGHYLSQVAPVSFTDEFSHGSKIEQMLAEYLGRIPCRLTLNGEEIRRLYRNETKIPGGPHKLTISEIEFIKLADVDGETGAVGWLGHHDYVRSITTSLGIRGLRARIGDIQIGEENLLEDCFKESRFNGWSIGEIHVIDPRVIPNARRDNFELNHHAYNLITQIGPIAARITRRCRTASISRNSALIIRNTVDQIDQRLTQLRPLSPAELSKFRASILRCRQKLKGVLEPDSIELLGSLAQLEERLSVHATTDQSPGIALDEALALVAKYVTNRDQARKLAEALRQICG
jgi:molecular chaperone HtpG